MKKQTPTIAIGYNTAHYAWMMRKNLIFSLIDHGYKVIVMAPRDDYSSKLEEIGVEFIDIPMKMNRNPLTDLMILARFISGLSRCNPSIFLSFTAKPNIYGTLAASFLGIPAVSNIAGLGSAFIAGGPTAGLLKFLYRIALKRSFAVFFQNPDDSKKFISERIVSEKKVIVLPGSGVDLDRFHFVESRPINDRNFSFILIARMLKDKGVLEYVHAAKMIKSERDDVDFFLLGQVESDNPAAIGSKQISEWHEAGFVSYLGFVADVRPHVFSADCVVLPSYREGTPRSLLEAAACGRPVITTDAVGCREVVINGKTGLLCSPRDANDLAKKMRMMLDMPSEDRIAMGHNGRAYIEARFDERIVIETYLDVIRSSE